MKKIIFTVVASYFVTQSAVAGDVQATYKRLGLNEYQCHAEGTLTIKEKNWNNSYLFPMNVFAKSIEEAYQIALNKLEVRRLDDAGNYISVTVSPNEGRASVKDLNCVQLK